MVDFSMSPLEQAIGSRNIWQSSILHIVFYIQCVCHDSVNIIVRLETYKTAACRIKTEESRCSITILVQGGPGDQGGGGGLMMMLLWLIVMDLSITGTWRLSSASLVITGGSIVRFGYHK